MVIIVISDHERKDVGSAGQPHRSGSPSFALLQLDNIAVSMRQRQFVAEAFPLANDGLALLLAFFVELVHVFHRTPMCDVPHFVFTAEPNEHAAARQQANRAFVQRQQWSTGPLLLLAHENGKPRNTSLLP
jgi:hypothetical protein